MLVLMRRARTWVVGGVLVAAVLGGGSGCGYAAVRPGQADGTSTTLPASADRSSADGSVVRRCGSHYAADFDAGLESRTVSAGPVSLVAFRVSPLPTGQLPVKTFKLMVRLQPGSEASLATITAGTSLLYDRARFTQSNAYLLSDGDRRVTFVGCPEQPAVFNGAVLNAGPTTVDVQVITGDRLLTARVIAYGS